MIPPSRGPLAVGALLVLLVLVPQLAGRPQPDIAWLLYAAERILEGERLYVDLVEPNPPLIVWLNLPAAWLARATGASGARVYQLMVAVGALASVLVCARLLRRAVPSDGRLRWLAGLAIVFALFPLVGTNFGQREHLALIVTLPLALLAVLRLGGVRMGAPVAAGIGLAAGVGIALKPYFILPWLALEACVRIAGGHGLRPLPETVAVIATGGAYLLAVVLLAPEYLTLAPLMAGAYYDFMRNTLPVTAFAGEGGPIALATLLLALLLRDRARHRHLWLVLGALTAGYYAAAVAQHKGWEYHFYPSVASGALLLVVAAADLRRPLQGVTLRLSAAAAVATVATLAVTSLAACLARALEPRAARYDADPSFAHLLPLVSARAADGPVMVLSWSAVSGFPLLAEAGARSALRFNCLWMLAGVYGAAARHPEPLRYREPAEMEPLERYTNEAVVEDLVTRRPSLLLVLAPAPDDPEWGLRRIDLLGYFRRDERFVAGFSRYRFLETVGQYWAFERLPESAPPAPPPPAAPRWDPARVAAVRAAERSRRVDAAAVAGILVFLFTFGLVWSRESRAVAARVQETPEAV